MARFWEPLPDERARVLVQDWGASPIESLRSEVVDPAAVVEWATLGAEVAANCAEPLAAISAIRSARGATGEAGAEVGSDWHLVQILRKSVGTKERGRPRMARPD